MPSISPASSAIRRSSAAHTRVAQSAAPFSRAISRAQNTPVSPEDALLFVQAAATGKRSTIERLLRELGPKAACAATAAPREPARLRDWAPPTEQTALIAAIRAGRREVVDLLLPHSDVFQKASRREPWAHALYEAVSCVARSRRESVAHRRAATAILERVVRHARRRRDSAAHGNQWGGALGVAAFHDLIDAAKLVLPHANWAFTEPFESSSRWTPFEIAAARGSWRVAALLAPTRDADERFIAFSGAACRGQWESARVIAECEMKLRAPRWTSASLAVFKRYARAFNGYKSRTWWEEDDSICMAIANVMESWRAATHPTSTSTSTSTKANAMAKTKAATKAKFLPSAR
ncbi:hypothetical protein LA345_13165 [Burkholderia vietnamiensis]|uniref:Ankyrin n=1 Tax=Burkholderia vietnamiensis (strain G4 / LMG 22486) TaxID=269482 RepID=A4JFQ0_BURVG|nr:hypothetical protein Bcep1808_2101 [Burkholderia vietnamiensis G4]MCB4344863.1 hypothetical protein [Burkholderia vietnamiensis]